MTLTVTNIGDNPQQPAIIAYAYIPDQLIAGELKIVSDNATITGGAALKRGTVLGQITIGAAGTPTAAGGNTGNGTISAVALGTKAKTGTYTIVFTGATTYNVLNPNGVELAPGTAAGAYGGSGLDPEITFTFTAGGTAMVAGDKITIAVAAGSGKYNAAVATATDGSQTPVAILADDADATGGDVNAGIYLQAEVNGNALIYDNSFTLSQITTALRTSHIFVKSSVSAADPS